MEGVCSSEGVECDYSEDNLIDSMSQVHSEAECRQICEDTDGCEFITYYNSSAIPVSNICLMFETCDAKGMMIMMMMMMMMMMTMTM